MTIWNLILLSAIAVFALKFAGYLVPQSLLQRPTPARVSNLLTVALLSALIAVQTLERGGDIVVDARVPAVLLAGGLFALKVPFIVVIVVAAATAALLRLFFGWS